MRLRNLAVSALGLLLLVGCSGEPAAPAGDRIREVVTTAGATQLGWVDVSPTTVRVYYLEGSEPMAVTKASGDASTSASPAGAPLLTAPKTIDQLKLEEFTARLGAVQGCADGTYGTIHATHGGAVLQQVGCSVGQAGTMKESYLDGQLLTTIDGWTEASLTAQLAEFRVLVGDQTRQLNFYTPRSTTSEPSYKATAISAPVPGVDGQECFDQASRAGTMPEAEFGMVTYRGCEGATTLGDTDFAASELSSAKILAALQRGAERLKINVDDFGDFTVISVGGELKVQMQVAEDVNAEVPFWSEPIS